MTDNKEEKRGEEGNGEEGWGGRGYILGLREGRDYGKGEGEGIKRGEKTTFCWENMSRGYVWRP